MGTVIREGEACPKCGLPVNWIEHRKSRGHVYLYAAHVIKENGQRKVKKCYLGAERYTYVSGQHRDLGIELKGSGKELEGEPRILDYIAAMTKGLEAQLEAEKLSPSKALSLASSLEGLVPKLQRLVTELRDYAKARQAEEDKEGGKQ
jgi:hypothetical protein